MSLAGRRTDYDVGPLERDDLDDDPVVQWWTGTTRRWPRADEPNAMTVATVDAAGRPDARVVLVRGVDERGFAFYTNLGVGQGAQLAARPFGGRDVRMVAMHRQVRVRGPSSRCARGRGRRLLRQPPAASRIGAWASPQSEVLADRAELDALVHEVEARFPGDDVPRPPHWGGLRIVPAGDRVLAGPPEPPARPVPLPARRAGGLDRRAPRALSSAWPTDRPARRASAVDQRLGVGVEPGTLPVPAQRAGAPHPRRQLELHAAAGGPG